MNNCNHSYDTLSSHWYAFRKYNALKLGMGTETRYLIGLGAKLWKTGVSINSDVNGSAIGNGEIKKTHIHLLLLYIYTHYLANSIPPESPAVFICNNIQTLVYDAFLLLCMLQTLLCMLAIWLSQFSSCLSASTVRDRSLVSWSGINRSVMGQLSVSDGPVIGQWWVCDRSAMGQLSVSDGSVIGQRWVHDRSAMGQLSGSDGSTMGQLSVRMAFMAAARSST